MDWKWREVRRLRRIILRGVDWGDGQNQDYGIVWEQMLEIEKLQIWNGGKKQRWLEEVQKGVKVLLDCSAIEEEEGGRRGGGGGGGRGGGGGGEEEEEEEIFSVTIEQNLCMWVPDS